MESITGGSSHITGFNFCSHILNGRKFSTLNDAEIKQLTSLRNEGRKDGFVVRIQPVDVTPELQLERYLASSWESEIEIYKRVPSIVVICKISGLSALAGSENKMFLNMDYLSCGTETDDQDCQD